jgi:hypothetical protein
VSAQRALATKLLKVGRMRIQVDENISIEVYFDPADREKGYQDDIRFRLIESGPKERRIFKADETGFLLTVNQAEQLASALQEAANASKSLPRSTTLKVVM